MCRARICDDRHNFKRRMPREKRLAHKPFHNPKYSRRFSTGRGRIAMNFDATFLTRLRQRDPEACAFLISSLTPMLEAKLRYKFRDHGTIEDIRNETFCRVFSLVDRGCVRQPERFGAFVWGVCDKVAQETYRKTRAAEPLPCAMEAPDRQPHRDELLVNAER